MGEIADSVFEGILCQLCGSMVDGTAVEYPRTCQDCEDFDEEEFMD